MDSSIIELCRDLAKKAISLKFQNFIIAILLILFVYKNIFINDFAIVKDFLLKEIPKGVLSRLQDLLIPILNFLYFIACIGFTLLIVLTIIALLNEKKGWFSTFLINYKYLFAAGKDSLADSLGEKFLVMPVNLGIIISIITYLFDNSKIVHYYENINSLYFIPIFSVLLFYEVGLVSFFIRPMKDYYA